MSDAATVYRTAGEKFPGDVPPVDNTFTADEIKALELEHRRIGVIPSSEGAFEVVIRSAEKLQWRKFRSAALDDDSRADAQENLITDTVVAVAYAGEKAIGKEPARALLKKLLNDYPAMCDSKHTSDLVKKLNGDVGPRAGK
jgi:hypothetical protein